MAMDIFESKYTAEDFETAVGAVLAPFEEGRKAEWNKFWDIYQDYGRRTVYNLYNGPFSGIGWTDENFNPKYPLVVTDAAYMFRQTGITDLTKEGVVLDFSQCSKFGHTFAYSHINKMPFIDLSLATETTNTFNSIDAESLHLRFSETTSIANNMFTSVTGLVNLRIEGTIAKSISFAQSNLLTTDAVQSVINALKDLTGATAQTFTVHKTVGGNMTAAQKAEITAKNWTLVY
jgi:hypothetical protein